MKILETIKNSLSSLFPSMTAMTQAAFLGDMMPYRRIRALGWIAVETVLTKLSTSDSLTLDSHVNRIIEICQ